MGSGGVALLSWHRVVFDLRNTRNTLARQHPQFVFHAIAKHATRESGLEIPWLLYPSKVGSPTGFATARSIEWPGCFRPVPPPTLASWPTA